MVLLLRQQQQKRSENTLRDIYIVCCVVDDVYAQLQATPKATKKKIGKINKQIANVG